MNLDHITTVWIGPVMQSMRHRLNEICSPNTVALIPFEEIMELNDDVHLLTKKLIYDLKHFGRRPARRIIR